MSRQVCFCGSGKKFEVCCSPIVSGKKKAKTPEQLMRSRYSAFCTRNDAYLLATHHPSQRAEDERDALLQTISTTKWLGLKVLKTEKKRKEPNTGYVEFVAFYETEKIMQLHERSKFVYENQEWFYYDGVLKDPLKFKRNDPCWCGSGKKFKKCHGNQ